MSKPQEVKVDYGNWTPRKLIYVPSLLTVVFAGLSFLSPFFIIGVFIFLMLAAYLIYTYFQFSPKGKNLQVKIRDLVFEQLIWDGDGTLLDIGCGNGALAIDAAKKYPEAGIVGIDYWGKQWDYSKKACEKNAQVAGVAERISFQKASAVKLPFPDNFFDVTVSNLVFHEVQDAKDKREVIKEALRVLKKGGLFVFQDLFLVKSIYGETQDLLATIKSWSIIEDIHFMRTSNQKFIPKAMQVPFVVGRIGIIHGRK